MVALAHSLSVSSRRTMSRTATRCCRSFRFWIFVCARASSSSSCRDRDEEDDALAADSLGLFSWFTSSSSTPSPGGIDGPSPGGIDTPWSGGIDGPCLGGISRTLTASAVRSYRFLVLVRASCRRSTLIRSAFSSSRTYLSMLSALRRRILLARICRDGQITQSPRLRLTCDSMTTARLNAAGVMARSVRASSSLIGTATYRSASSPAVIGHRVLRNMHELPLT
jgi:hypothetical protein